MFLDEARIAGSIRHPNVVGIHEVQADVNDCYIVMDYVEGMTLGDMSAAAEARNAMLPFSASIAIMLDVLARPQCAHDLANEQGEPMHVVHRDVSPANVIVGLDGTARVGDFGIARATSRLTRTQPGIVKGRFLYAGAGARDGRHPRSARRRVLCRGGALPGSSPETGSGTRRPSLRRRSCGRRRTSASGTRKFPPMLAAVCATALRGEPRAGDGRARRSSRTTWRTPPARRSRSRAAPSSRSSSRTCAGRSTRAVPAAAPRRARSSPDRGGCSSSARGRSRRRVTRRSRRTRPRCSSASASPPPARSPPSS